MKTSYKLASAALLASLALTACSDGETGEPKTDSKSSNSSATPTPSPTDAPTETPSDTPTEESPSATAEGKKVATDFFESVVQADWEDATAQAKQANSLAVVAYREAEPDESGFMANINVVRVKLAREFSEEELVAGVEAELKSIGAEVQGDFEKVTVDGDQGYVFHSTLQGRHLYQLQVTKDGYSFVTTSSATNPADAEANLVDFAKAWNWLV